MAEGGGIGAAVTLDGGTQDGARSSRDPAAEEVRLAIRLLLALTPGALTGGLVVGAYETTQDGLAHRLAVTQGAVSKVLQRLVAAHVVRVERGHVNGFSRRVRVYTLTGRGTELVRAYRLRFGTDGGALVPPRTS